MLTPQEVTNSQFEKAVFGGYDITSVDKFLEQVTQDYSALYRENGILKSKMKVLVDKVEEYRTTEDAMRMALLTAEKTAKEIVAEAEKRAAAIDGDTESRKAALLDELDREAGGHRAELERGVRAEEQKLAAMKAETARYLEGLKSAMAAYAEQMARLSEYAAEPEAAEAAAEPTVELESDRIAAAVKSAASAQAAVESIDWSDSEPEKKEDKPVQLPPDEDDKETDDSVEEIAALINKAFENNENNGKPEEEIDRTITNLPQIDYDNLQFGSNYNRGK